MATWPSTKAGTTHLDAGTDSPKLARADIYQNVQNVNEIIDMFNISSPSDNQILKYNTSNQRFELAASTGETLTIVGDDSTGTAITLGETFKIAGSGGVTTAVSGDTLTITGPNLSGYLQNVVEDTTPQLGGSLDLNSNDITGTGNISITGDISTDAITLADNVIKPIRSNDILRINGATPTGDIYIGNVSDGTMSFSGSFAANAGPQMSYVNSAADVQTSNIYPNARMVEVTLANNVTAANRVRQHNTIDVDLAGYDWSSTSFGAGPQNGLYTTIKNTGASATNSIGTVTGVAGGVFLRPAEGNNSTMTMTSIFGNRVGHISYIDSGATADITNVYGFHYNPLAFSGMTGTTTIDNEYAFFANSGTFRATKSYAFFANNDTYLSRVGTLERYRESTSSLTSSASITVDCNTAPIHTVTLDNNATFTLSNLSTGQTVTVIITQGTTGGTGTFSSVKFPNGAPTLSTGSGKIDVVTVFYDGTNYLGNIAKDFTT